MAITHSTAADDSFTAEGASAWAANHNIGADTVTQAQTAELRTSDSPQFAGINLGHASDTTLTRLSAGVVAVEGVQLATGTGTASGTNTGDQTRASLALDTTDSPMFAGINLGHVSDTTITRVSAGLIAVEGVQLARGTGTASGTNTGDQTLPTRGTLGLDTTDSPQFAGLNIGAASDTTITRVSAGVIAVEGVQLATGTGTASGTNTGDQTLPTRASLGLDTTDSPQFAALNVGAATDTTITRTTAGNIAVEGNAIYRAGGTDVPLADGGTGASLADPNADRIMFWDDSAGAVTWLTAGTNLTITGTTIDATGGGGGIDTANSPAANEFARFTDADTIEGRTVAETRSDLGLGTADSPQLTAINLGHATDTTISRVSAGVVAIEGVPIATCYMSGYVDVINDSSSITTLTTASFTKVAAAFSTVNANGSTWWDTTNKRFLPLVAGRYLCNTAIGIATVGDNKEFILEFYKNGASHRRVARIHSGVGGGNVILNGATIVTLNGSTDYIEIFAYNGDTSDRDTEAYAQTITFQAVYIGPN